MPNRYTTAELDEALGEYRTACDAASQAVRRKLRDLATTLSVRSSIVSGYNMLMGQHESVSHTRRLWQVHCFKTGYCVQEGYLSSLLSAAKLSLIAGTLDLHTSEARRRKWCHAELLDFDTASALL